MPHVGEWNRERRWIYDKGYVLKKGERKGVETHVLLDGGRAAIPNEANEEFMRVHARSLFEGDWVYVVEKKTLPVYYMASEFDIQMREREVTSEEIDRMIAVIQRGVFSKAFPDRDVTMVVSTAPPKEAKLDDGTPCTQSGIHFNWRVPVDARTAWILRAWMIRELSEAFSDFQMAIGWQQAFDDCIYRDNGLRMIGSRKAMPCPTCHGQSLKAAAHQCDAPADWGTACTGCQNAGKLDMGRPYTLARVVDGQGAEIPDLRARMMGDPLLLVKYTTIRAIEPDGKQITQPAEINFPSEALRVALLAAAERDMNSKKRGRVRKVPEKDGAVAADLAQKAKKKDKDGALSDLSPEDPAYVAISSYIRGEFSGMPTATHVKKSGSGDLYIVNTDCTWCANKGGNHGHSSVYFVVRPKGCAQRCFCPKDAIQPCGRVRCSEYASRPHEIPKEVMEAIFSPSVRRVRQKEEAKFRLAEYMGPALHRGPRPYDVRVPVVVAQAEQPAGPPPQSYRPRARKVGCGYTPEDFLKAVQNVNWKIIR